MTNKNNPLTAADNSISHMQAVAQGEMQENATIEVPNIVQAAIKDQMEYLRTTKPLIPFLQCAAEDVTEMVRKLREKDPAWQPPDDMYIWSRVIERARELSKTSDLPAVKSSRLPEKYLRPNTLLSNCLPDGGLLDGEIHGFRALGTGRGACVNGIPVLTTFLGIYGLPWTGVEIQGDFTEYDRHVHDAVSSLFLYGDESGRFTPTMVYRTMTGNRTVNPTEKQLKPIVLSIDKLRLINTVIDASAEARKRELRDESGGLVTKLKFENYMLPLKKGEYKAGGKIVVGYCFLDEPPLLAYARKTGQLLTIPMEMLDVKAIDDRGRLTKTSVKTTPGRIAIRNYLLAQIQIFKHDEERAIEKYQKYELRRAKDQTLPEKDVSKFREQTHFRTFETIFREAGQHNTSRVTRADNKKYVELCLEFWEKRGLIKGYQYAQGKDGEQGIQILI